MPAPVIAAAAAPVVGGIAGKIIGGGGPSNAQPALPKDLQGQRANNIGLLNYLLGFNQQNAPWNPQQQQRPASQGGPMQRGLPTATAPGQNMTPWDAVNRGMPGASGGMSPWGGVNQGMGGMASLLGGGSGMNTGQPNIGPGMPVSRQMGGGTPANAGTNGGLSGGWASPGNPNHPGVNNTLTMGPGDPNYVSNRAMSFSGAPTSRFNGPQMNSQGGGFQSPMGNVGFGGGGSNPMLDRMESYFGPLGTPTTALQQQSLGGISQFLNSNPYGQSNNFLNQVGGGAGYNEANQAYRNIGQTNYGGAAGSAFGQAGDMFKGVGGANYFGGAQNAFNELANGNFFGNAEGVFNRLEGYNPFQAAQTSMEGILGTNPGMQGMDALRPLLDRNLAAANQEGGRFGSANAILRSRAVDDNNLLAANMYQRGVDQQIGAAGQYGQMGNSLIGARQAAGQGLLGVGQGRMQQQTNAAQGQLGVGQGRLSQGLGAANGMLGVGQGQLGVGQLGLQGALGSAGGLAGLAQALQGDRLNAAQGLASNQNSLFGNMTGAYGVGTAQANQEAQRQQQALQILLGQLGVSQGATLGTDNVVSPTGAQQGAAFGSQFASLIPLLMAQGGGGGGGNTWGPASQYGFGG
jgi:hypothetical protein